MPLPKVYLQLPSRDRRKIGRLLARFEAIPKKCSKEERKKRDRLKERIARFDKERGRI